MTRLEVMMREEYSESMVPLLLMSLLEEALNKAIAMNAKAAKSVASHCGKVVRIKTSGPRISIYVVLCSDGVRLMSQFDGAVDARVSTKASALVLLALAPSFGRLDELPQLKVSGNRELVDELMRIASDVNIWQTAISILEDWFPGPSGANQFFASIKGNDGQWREQLQDLPQLIDRTFSELQLQTQSLQKQLDETVHMRQLLVLQERRSAFYGFFGLALMLLACLVAVGILDLSWLTALPIEAVFMGVIGFSLLLSRLSHVWVKYCNHSG